MRVEAAVQKHAFHHHLVGQIQVVLTAVQHTTATGQHLGHRGQSNALPSVHRCNLPRRCVGLVSLEDGMDLSTAAGRLMANVLASVAQFETEVRAERVLAGQAKARKAGRVWGGSEAGRLISVTEDQAEAIVRMNSEGVAKAKIARATGVSRPTVYRVLKHRSA
ncbi:recombinase family protein [Roseiconus lacunae]|uniref:recombinase family protein n=1 Tax=Roseiconus lacunae TaxID=2605694 RepID=UPI0028F3F4E9|nr:recombinase family protein [Roseiconus lacunae]